MWDKMARTSRQCSWYNWREREREGKEEREEMSKVVGGREGKTLHSTFLH